jgi:predicted extracellular nuclease
MMNKDLLRLGILAAFLTGILIISWAGGYLTGRTISTSYGSSSDSAIPSGETKTVSQTLQELPLDSTINVQGSVSRILDDYTSKKGYQYQQFYVSDGAKDLKVFCSKYKGSVSVKKGDNVSVTGKFQKYSSTYELYGECNGVEVL